MGLLDNVSRLGAALGAAVEGLNSPKRPLSCAYKAPRRSPICWSIFFLAPSSCALRFSFAIYSFPRVDKRPHFDGVRVLSTDRPYLSPRIYRRIGLSVLKTPYPPQMRRCSAVPFALIRLRWTCRRR